MSSQTIASISSRLIEYSFYLLFFLLPLVFTPLNYELFEYNKMMLVYAFTIIIIASWLVKMAARRCFYIQRTPLDIPIILYLASHFISTVFSIDPHTSIWGYYSRFHEGLLATISYVLLYYALVSNFSKAYQSPSCKKNVLNLEFRISNLFGASNLEFRICKLLFFSLLSGILVSFYGILQRFGIDSQYWVQDVQNRVFSTMGQPNWLAAYLVILLPIAIAFVLNLNNQAPNSKQIPSTNVQNSKRKKFWSLEFGIWKLFGHWNLGFRILPFVFYLCLLFTKSRSGFLAFWLVFSLFITLLIAYLKKITKMKLFEICHLKFVIDLFICLFVYLFITFIIGSPFSQINRYFSWQSLRANNQQPATSHQQSDLGGTESMEIRNIVWRGAIRIWQRYPFFGSGVETFAYAYYQDRPAEHNLTSEWDFLYNKAHNEYLNLLATTGLFGLGSYLLIILAFIIWFLKNSKSQALNPKSPRRFGESRQNAGQYQNSKSKIQNRKSFANLNFENWKLFGNWNLEFGNLNIALFSSWLSILITNFFGFSVVIIGLYFFLIPAMVFSLTPQTKILSFHFRVSPRHYSRLFAFITIIFTIALVFFAEFTLAKLWFADTRFSRSRNLSRAGQYQQAHSLIKQAVKFNSREPLYQDEFANISANLAVSFYNQSKEASPSPSLSATVNAYINEAQNASKIAIAISPVNLSLWKSRTKMFYSLSQIDPRYLQEALNSLIIAQELGPTDAKISYNLGLIYAQAGLKDEAIETLQKTIEMKPDYRDAYYTLALFYEKNKQKDKAVETLEKLLKLWPDDQEAKKLRSDPPN